MEVLWQLDVHVVFIFRGEEIITYKESYKLQEDDIFRIRGNAKEIDNLIQREPGFDVKPSREWKDVDVTRGDYELIEAVVAPDSDYDGRKVSDIDFAQKYEAVALRVYKRGKPKQDALKEIIMGGGDSVLLALREKRIHDLKGDSNFVIVSDVEVERFATQKVPIALAVLAGIVATAAILAPLSIETAGSLGVAARPFLMAITFAASLGLITLWGYQTNTLIYRPGRYRFTDFTKVGTPLNFLFLILGAIFIPMFWSF